MDKKFILKIQRTNSPDGRTPGSEETKTVTDIPGVLHTGE
jgi:hypothetical protein